MAAIAPIGIFLPGPPPLTRSFTPVTSNPNPFYRSDYQASEVGLAYRESLVIVTKVANTPAGVNRVKLTLVKPRYNAVAPVESHENRVVCEFLLPNKGSQQDRHDLRIMFAAMLSEPQIGDAVDSLVQPY
jgi:hypothetical protein